MLVTSLLFGCTSMVSTRRFARVHDFCDEEFAQNKHLETFWISDVYMTLFNVQYDLKRCMFLFHSDSDMRKVERPGKHIL